MCGTGVAPLTMPGVSLTVAAATRGGRFGEYNYRWACIAQLVEQLTLFPPVFNSVSVRFRPAHKPPKPRPKWSKSSDLQDCRSAKNVIHSWLRLDASPPHPPRLITEAGKAGLPYNMRQLPEPAS